MKALMKMKRLVIFDLDDTLVIPDNEVDQNNLYMTIDHHVPIPEMMTLFEHVMDEGCFVQILTNRHPDLKNLIELRYSCIATCRDYCLSVPEMERVEMDKLAKEQFMAEMVRWKTQYINRIASDYDHVVFYDDMAHRYDQSKFVDNVSLKLPLHLCKENI